MKFIYKFKPFNRRKDERVQPCRLIKSICTYIDSGKEIQVTPDIVDVSKGGLLIATQNKIYPGTKIEIKLQFPEKKETISVHGEIRRTFRRHSQSWYFSGVRFLDKEEKGIQVLLDYALRK